jgi:hypothetical protein
MSTQTVVSVCQSGAKCLPTDCCFSLSEWSEMSTHRLLFQFVRVERNVYPQTVVRCNMRNDYLMPCRIFSVIIVRISNI